ncbi:hypothetical protein AF72_11760 [Xylella taiwanensis]|uniref:Uncharacterized protein n=1 Tax=Xylella taiwanensis TaxID=1444770 RepID=Z9JFR0_9GAMM|nr:hypothetical protein AF72_11760 [Xylella taiwanensis]
MMLHTRFSLVQTKLTLQCVGEGRINGAEAGFTFLEMT